MEFASNLLWVIVSLILLGTTYLAVRRKAIRLSMASAMMLAVVICVVLLPVISVSDDLLAASQASLPFSGQTWRISSEDASVGLDLALALAVFSLLLAGCRMESYQDHKNTWEFRPLAGRLVRSQLLRPPPAAVA